jgi:hypothetical protein
MGDVDALRAIDDTPEGLMRRRFARGDVAYIGELGDRILCKQWFHRGPLEHDEDGEVLATWALDAETYWSYDGAARCEARASGVFVKMFQTALCEMFETGGARRVQGQIRADNTASLNLHDGLGFARIGTVTSVVWPGARYVRWSDHRGTRHWIVPSGRSLTFALPP